MPVSASDCVSSRPEEDVDSGSASMRSSRSAISREPCSGSFPVDFR